MISLHSVKDIDRQQLLAKTIYKKILNSISYAHKPYELHTLV